MQRFKGYSNYLDIANNFASNYSEFVSSVISSELLLQDIEQSIKHDIISVYGAESDHGHCQCFTDQDVKSSIKSLNASKSDDIDGLMSDYFKHSTALMIEIITCVLNFMLVHGCN